MNLPDNFRALMAQAYAEWKRDADTAPLGVIFPPEVIKRLEALGPPSWDWLKDGLRRIHSDYRLEERFGEDVVRLMDDEDGFAWPLEDPVYCFTLGVMRDYGRRALGKLPPGALDRDHDPDHDDDDDRDAADWWKA